MKHKWLIAFGCFFWYASFFCEESGLQPYSTVGLVIAPILIVVGIFGWVLHYYKTRGHYPRIGHTISMVISGMTKNPFFGIGFLFSHLLQFWTLITLFWIGISFLGFGIFGNSDAFIATQQYCETNSSILSNTGRIKYYSPLIGGNIRMHNDDGSAELFFTIIGAKGNFDAESRLIKQDGNWMVQELKMKQ
ncbi:hypothetical protein [Hymenobacter siberiensis]|uniref:hypothetical protein n=1 Tax=Hymenobacter siberiensis TaxID=2848396 RepID=UPI001C1DD776|nr:hypothetical protein [Hymenobacter siberiensis]